MSNNEENKAEDTASECKALGRPTLYREEYIEQARRLALLGLTNEEMAKFFDVGITTFDRWMAAHEDFRCAVKEAKVMADGEIAASLFHRAKGYSHPEVEVKVIGGQVVMVDITKHYPPDTGAAMAWLKNRQPKYWRDRPAEEGNGESQLANALQSLIDKLPG
jgi:hypothetical protein